ncbi:MAG: hypothetical protein EA368_15510 [Leptolyngbya sp. DLM2.Bin27]|nr:MAG: hypothetical protein EA368_15510 [Leptolyngbya sp. DLM2.Bin27]
MAPKKLTEADKTAILSLYRQPQETTSTLAERYGVSNSTISRLLKASLPEAEYSVLIQQKRGSTDRAVVVSPVPFAAEPEAASRKRKAAPSPEPAAVAESAVAESAVAESAVAPEPTPTLANSAKPTRKRRSTATAPEEPAAEAAVTAEPAQLSLPEPAAEAPEKPARPVLKSAQTASAELADDKAADLDDDWGDDNPVLGDDYDDDGDDDDDDDSAYSWEGDEPTTTNFETLEISPLTAAALPSLCYVVVERTSSELVVLPLSTFAELGQIPEAEGEARTLPVFENHNVARRFSRRNQRVIKVPDGTLLQTTSSYLQAKGITRLFIDGQVFALEPDPLPDPLADADH